jgi:hypothetical protein
MSGTVSLSTQMSVQGLTRLSKKSNFSIFSEKHPLKINGLKVKIFRL